MFLHAGLQSSVDERWSSDFLQNVTTFIGLRRVAEHRVYCSRRGSSGCPLAFVEPRKEVSQLVAMVDRQILGVEQFELDLLCEVLDGPLLNLEVVAGI